MPGHSRAARVAAETVTAANALTARWCALAPALARGNTVLSGATLWPLLALLSSAATGTARDELGAVVGRPLERARDEAVDLVGTIDAATAAGAALGLWLPAGRELADAEWGEGLPPGTVDTLDDPGRLDAWAAAHTLGLITRFPLPPTPRDALLLACALGVRTRWRTVFSPSPLVPDTGPWRGRRIDGLGRTTDDLDAITLLTDPEPVTRIVVAGVDDIDVHLLIGEPDAQAGAVLDAGLRAAASAESGRSARELSPGAAHPGLTVAEINETRDTVRLTVPAFDLRASHDLCADPSLFGLRAAMDPRGGALPALGPELYLARGKQDVLATFSWEGFAAAAVSSFAVFASAVLRPPSSRARRVEVTLDRPFGFLAVHRDSGLALVAGWVADPNAPGV
jgi:hypothetical protein